MGSIELDSSQFFLVRNIPKWPEKNEIVYARIFLNSLGGPMQAVFTNKRLVTIQPRSRIIVTNVIWVLAGLVGRIPLIGPILKLLLAPWRYLLEKLTKRSERLSAHMSRVEDKELLALPLYTKKAKIKNNNILTQKYGDVIRNTKSVRVTNHLFSLRALKFKTSLITFVPVGLVRSALSRVLVAHNYTLVSNRIFPELVSFVKDSQGLLDQYGCAMTFNSKKLVIRFPAENHTFKNTIGSSSLSLALLALAVGNAFLSSRGFKQWGQQALDDTFFWGIPLVAASLWAYIHCRSFTYSLKVAAYAWLVTWLVVAQFFWFVYPAL